MQSIYVTGNDEFSYTTAFWRRASILKGSLKLLLSYKIKRYIIKFFKSNSNFEYWLVFTDSLNLTSFLKKQGFSSIQKNNLDENIHYKNYFENTTDGLDFYQQSLFEIKAISCSNIIIWDGSGFAKASIYLSNNKKSIYLREVLGFFIIIDYIYRIFSLIRRYFVKKSLLNITK